MDEHWLTDDWKKLKQLLPENWEEMACETKAFVRARKIRSPEQLLRFLLIHVAAGLSLRVAVARAAMCGLPEITDVGLMFCLRKSQGWLQKMREKLLQKRASQTLTQMNTRGFRVLCADSTIVKENGEEGSAWRLHYAIEIPSLFCTQATVSDEHTGENLCLYQIVENDLILCDRNYCKAAQISHVLRNKGHIITRWHSKTLPLSIPIPASLTSLTNSNDSPPKSKLKSPFMQKELTPRCASVLFA